jgi:uncharacterized protein (TIGR02145 family)
MKNMKGLFATVILLLNVYQINSAFAQTVLDLKAEYTVNESDSVVLRLGQYTGETVQWQFSIDQQTWTDISEANADTLLFVADITTHFRAKVIAGNCDPFYSDVIKVIVSSDQPGQGVTDIDGNFYPSVVIGNQEWMAENLKTTKYRNGTLIEYPGSNNSTWTNNTTGAYAWYQNVPTWKDKYGAFYNWYAVNNSHGLCPVGWHVPNDAEWTGLVNYLASQGFPNSFIASGAGNALKSCRQENSPLGGDCNTTEHPRWNSNPYNYGFDEFGFSALPASERYSNGNFYELGQRGSWWTATDAVSNDAWQRQLYDNDGRVYRFSKAKTVGYSVRCVRYIGSGLPPTLITLPLSVITDLSAVSGGNITDTGGEEVIARGVVWSTSEYPTTENNHGLTSNSPGTGNFTSHLTGLSPGATYYVRAYAINIVGTNYGQQEIFSTTTGGMGTVTDIDGNIYPTIIIGDQEWMAENLKTTHYRSGTPIEYPGSNSSAWTNNITGAYAWNNNNIVWKDIYGALYNWYAVNNGNGLCPAGWHVPSDEELTELVNYVVAQGYPNSNVINGAGNALKSCRQQYSPLGGNCGTTEHPRWDDYTHYGNNEFGFSAFPGGYRDQGGSFNSNYIGKYGYWWSSTEQSITNSLGFELSYAAGNFFPQNNFPKKWGLSIRCVKNAIPVLPPTITTLPAIIITDISAVSGGNITNDGGEPVTARGVVWSTSPNPELDNNDGFTNDGTGGDEFESNIPGLSPETTYFVRAYATNSAGISYGQEESFTTLPAGTVTDIDNNVYSTIVLGNREWMAENLKTTRYRDGTPITYPGSNNTAWQNNTTGAYSWYYNNIAWKDSYGALYNWYAINNSNELCPSGWHVPSHEDWILLEQSLCNQLGNENCDAQFPYDNTTTGSLGTNEGNALKSCRQVSSPLGGDCATSDHPRWNSDATNYGTNEIDFSALPGGTRNTGGDYSYSLGNGGYWWSLTESDSNRAWYRGLYSGNGNVGRNKQFKQQGFSVRCVKYIGPILQTNPVVNATANSAVSGGNITNDVGEEIIARGVVWSASQNPSIENNLGVTNNGTGLGSFTSVLTSLAPNTTYYVRAYASTSTGVSYGNQLSFVTQLICGEDTFLDQRDGSVYSTVLIGNKCWLKENLKYLPSVYSVSESSNNSPRYYVYDYQGSSAAEAKLTENYQNYGVLYNWPAALNACPTGWHMPSDGEWYSMNYYLMNNYDFVNNENLGNKLKSCRQENSPLGVNCLTSEHPRWNADANNFGSDDFGFSGLPGGRRAYHPSYGTSFISFGQFADWWSSSPSQTGYAWSFGISTGGSVSRYHDYVQKGAAVRCLVDFPVHLTVSTNNLTDITPTSALSGGFVTSQSTSPISARGIIWSTIQNPTIQSNEGFTADGTGAGSFTSNLTGLSPGTTYYVMAYATNELGTSYGNQIVFSTNFSADQGSFNNPYSVANAIANNQGSGVWVQGYITGVMETNVSPFVPSFNAPFYTSTNIIIADSPGETNLSNSLIIQLPAGAVREALNLVNNPGHKGKQVKLLGDLEAYFSQPGMRNTYGYWLDGGGIVPPISFFEETFPSNLGSFSAFNILGDQEWGHATFDGGCAVMSGFSGSTSYPNEDWLISPAIDLAGRNNVNLQIREAVNYLTSYADLKVLVSNNYSGGNPSQNGTWTELTGFSRPPGNNWVFVDSGNINLSGFDGQTIRIAFKYVSSSTGATTWEISKIILSEIY